MFLSQCQFKSKKLSMLILLSPAKSLDFESKINCKNHSLPFFTKEIEKLVAQLKKAKISDLEKTFDISKKLAELNFNRFQNFSKKFDFSNSRPALIAFDGDVYAGIDKRNFSEKDFTFAQEHLRILSGLYGILRPLDLIQPYRLEMGCDFKKFNFGIKSLYEFWGDKISIHLNSIENEYIINLASQEYFAAINLEKLESKVINIIFKEKKGDSLKIVGINAKKARGLMTNFIIKNKITDYKKLKDFGEANYKFKKELSNETNFVFIR